MNASPSPSPSDMLDALLRTRHSCRGFLPDKLLEAEVRAVVDTARRTASWCNAQPWALTVLGDAALDRLRTALFDFAAAHPEEAPDFAFPRAFEGVYRDRRRACGYSLYQAVGVALGDREAAYRQALENFRFFGAPHFALVTADEALGPYALLDCGALVNNFQLACHARGIASIAQASIAGKADFVRRFLDVPADRRIVCGIAFGYEDAAHRANGFRMDRAAIDEIATFVAE